MDNSPFSHNNQLDANLPPLGTQFNSYELNCAANYYTLDPFQYSITKFKYNNFDKKNYDREVDSFSQDDLKTDPGLIYKNIDFEKLLPSYTSVKKSVNDVPAQDYHRFLANDGYFNEKESIDNKDLWYYGANDIANKFIIAGATVNLQDTNHIIFPEPHRGGLDTRNVTKYSTVNTKDHNLYSWGSENEKAIDNNERAKFFDYNTNYSRDRNKIPFESVYSFDSNYCREIGINSEFEGTMPNK